MNIFNRPKLDDVLSKHGFRFHKLPVTYNPPQDVYMWLWHECRGVNLLVEAVYDEITGKYSTLLQFSGNVREELLLYENQFQLDVESASEWLCEFEYYLIKGMKNYES